MSGINIVPADGRHIDGIMAIEELSFKRPWRKGMFLDEMANAPFSAFFAAVDNNKVVGYAGLAIMVDECHIMNIAVHPDYRRKGIGQMLLDRLFRHSLENHVFDVTLEVGVLNTAAIEFYQKNGFKISGLRKGYYGDEDAYIMWRSMGDGQKFTSRGDLNGS